MKQLNNLGTWLSRTFCLSSSVMVSFSLYGLHSDEDMMLRPEIYIYMYYLTFRLL